MGAFESSGSTATTAILDIAHNDLYVANTGDGRVVAGWLNKGTGEWRCDVLTRDHRADDPEEKSR
jgi:serine/threonine protein phosphatase PrpC